MIYYERKLKIVFLTILVIILIMLNKLFSLISVLVCNSLAMSAENKKSKVNYLLF